MTGNSKTIDNIFYHIRSPDSIFDWTIFSHHLNAKLEQTCKLQRCYKNFDEAKFKNDLHKITWKEHTMQSTMPCKFKFSSEHFLQVINKLLETCSMPLCMSKSRSSFASKPWIATAIANSIKAKTSSTKKLV